MSALVNSHECLLDYKLVYHITKVWRIIRLDSFTVFITDYIRTTFLVFFMSIAQLTWTLSKCKRPDVSVLANVVM